jgi:hypothetical protein
MKKYGSSGSCYIIDGNTPFYIKYSEKRISPWTFSFTETHIREIDSINDELGNIFIVLVCNDDGICCLNFQEFCTIISVKSNLFPKWVKAQRRRSEKYTVTGSDGELTYKIGNNDFPQKLFSR